MLRYRYVALFVLLLLAKGSTAQELFVYSEPASNMPAKSIGLRVSNWLMRDIPADNLNYHLVPEVMWGANKHLMLHAEGYFSNRDNAFNAEGAGVYAKYRFYSTDKVNRHFRMAAFGRASTNNGTIHQEEIATNGHNTGYQAGVIGTQLLHKVALSATVYYERALDNQDKHEIPVAYSRDAVNYSLSIGKLMLPKAYTRYKQTNMNLIADLIGQRLMENGKSYLDIALSAQLIFNSQTRLDIGYKHELHSNMLRTAPNGAIIRVEHLLFNVL